MNLQNSIITELSIFETRSTNCFHLAPDAEMYNRGSAIEVLVAILIANDFFNFVII